MYVPAEASPDPNAPFACCGHEHSAHALVFPCVSGTVTVAVGDSSYGTFATRGKEDAETSVPLIALSRTSSNRTLTSEQCQLTSCVQCEPARVPDGPEWESE